MYAFFAVLFFCAFEGSLSRAAEDRTVFSQPALNLSDAERFEAVIGRNLFERIWVSSPSSTQSTDGLGPLFNARSCAACHVHNGRGTPPLKDLSNPSLLLRLGIPQSLPDNPANSQRGQALAKPDPRYGKQLQTSAISGFKPEARVRVTWHEKQGHEKQGHEKQGRGKTDPYAPSLRFPTWHLDNLAYGPLHPETVVSARLSPAIAGLGFLEAVPDSALLAAADPDDKDQDGISGRPHWVWSHEKKAMSIGRFGWKNGQATLDDQNQSAFHADIGISTPFFPTPAGDCTDTQKSCKNAMHGERAPLKGPGLVEREAPKIVTDAVLSFIRSLAPPTQRHPKDTRVQQGYQIFKSIGCTKCHTSQLVTGHQTERPWLSEKTIAPFTDLLLHDMGDGLADDLPEGNAEGREWRTPPLWGVGQASLVNGSAFYLHDGRARTLTEAILWHDGEARNVRLSFQALSEADQKALLQFLHSL